MLAGLDGGDAAEGVVALATRALDPPAGVACGDQKDGSRGLPTSLCSLSERPPPPPHLEPVLTS